MRKFALTMIATLLLAVMAIPASAVPPADLGTLARYYPEDTVFYTSIRTDTDYIEEVDTLLQSVIAQLPEGLVPPITVYDALNQLAGGGDFQEEFTWLGNSAAAGIVSADALVSDFPTDYLVLAFEITDTDAAQQFAIESDFDQLTVRRTSRGTFLYPSADVLYGTYYRITDDALILGSSQYNDERLPYDYLAYETRLADTDEFMPALERLPLDDYNAVAYLNTVTLAPFAEQIQAELDNIDTPLPTDVDLSALLQAVGAQSAGLTVLDDRSLVMDIAAYVNDPEALVAAGFEIGGSAVLDFDFTGLLGANNVLMIQDTGLGENILGTIAEMKAIGDFYEEEFSDQNILQADEEFALTFVDDVVTFFELTWSGLSGITFEEAFSWMTGDYIVYLNATDGTIFPVLPDFGVMVNVTDADAARAYNEAVANFFYESGVDVDEDGDANVIPVIGDMAQDRRFDVLFGSNEEVSALGMRAGVEAALNGAEGRLTETDAFISASETFLDNPQFLALINPAPLDDVITLLAEFESDFEVLIPILPILNSANITANYDDDGTGAVRLVITLNEE